jgi:hypothetical protein
MAKATRKNPPAPEGPEPDVAVEEDASPVAPDLSGWTPHPSERRDFHNRIRAFPPSVSAWRRRLLERIRSGQPPLPLAGPVDPGRLSDLLDEGISYLREVARILAVLHGSPSLGNKADPTDELVYILLSRHTREGAYQQAFDSLKSRFATWDDLLDAPRDEVGALVLIQGGISVFVSFGATASGGIDASMALQFSDDPPAPAGGT